MSSSNTERSDSVPQSNGSESFQRRGTLIKRLKQAGFRCYADYLQSEHWQDFKRRYRESGLPQHCLACEKPHYELHHRTYQFLGNESLCDVIPLCRDCHTLVHEARKVIGNSDCFSCHATLRNAFGWSKEGTRRRFEPFGGFNLGVCAYFREKRKNSQPSS